MKLLPRDDIAFQEYWTSSGRMVVAYTLGENRFTILQDDAATLVKRMLSGEDRFSILTEIRDQRGQGARDEASEFLDSVLPSFMDSVKPEICQRLQERCSAGAVLGVTEEEEFYDFCSQDGLFAVSSWELSYACNLRCVHCYNPHHTVQSQMDPARWLDLLDEAREMGLLRLCLTGGEVGVYPGFWDVFAKARRLHLAVDVFTNGLVFSDLGRARDLASLFPRSVQCSLYGATAATHEAITGVSGSWRKTVKCLEHFADLGVPIAIKCPAMVVNYREAPAVASIARRLDAVLQVDVNITARNDGDRGPTRMRLNDRQLSWLFNQPELPIYQGLERLGRSGTQVQGPDDRVCGAGSNGLSIQPDGTVVPCLSFMLPVGDARRQSLRDIWKGERLANWRKTTRRDRSGCDDCAIESHCTFCPGLALNDTGDFLSCSPNDCLVAKARASVHEQRLVNGE